MNKLSTSKIKQLEHWNKIIQDQAKSGLSITNYCQETDIREGAFYRWRRNLQAAGKNSLPEQDSPEIAPKGWTVCQEIPHQSYSTVVVEIGKCKLHVEESVSASHLEKICRVLVGLC